MHQNALFATDLANSTDLIDDSNLVVRVHNRDEQRVFTDCSCNNFRPNQAIAVRFQIGDFESFRFHVLKRIHYRFMFVRRRNHVAPSSIFGNTFNRKVVRFCGARGPNNFARICID